MILIEPLRYCIRLANSFNGLNRENLAFLMRKKYPRRIADMDIDKLIRLKILWETDGYIFTGGAKVKPGMSDAVRIMTTFYERNFLGFDKGENILLLSFSRIKDGRAKKYYVCRYEDISDLQASYRHDGEHEINIIIADNVNLDCSLLPGHVLAVLGGIRNRFKFYQNRMEVTINDF